MLSRKCLCVLFLLTFFALQVHCDNRVDLLNHAVDVLVTNVLSSGQVHMIRVSDYVAFTIYDAEQCEIVVQVCNIHIIGLNSFHRTDDAKFFASHKRPSSKNVHFDFNMQDVFFRAVILIRTKNRMFTNIIRGAVPRVDGSVRLLYHHGRQRVWMHVRRVEQLAVTEDNCESQIQVSRDQIIEMTQVFFAKMLQRRIDRELFKAFSCNVQHLQEMWLAICLP
ncbi:hypothetical protein HDE_00796 [Halotydeus destructor]|nr:hypothetical protein HDE_00796 [Halotydeus destructor]